MSEKRYDIVCEEARRRVKGIKCIIEMVDDGYMFHDSVIEHIDFDADNQVLIVDIGDVWWANQVRAGRFRFIFREYMEFNINYAWGNSFTYDFSIHKTGRGDLLTVSFNSLHLEVHCRDISVEENPYTEEELKRFKS